MSVKRGVELQLSEAHQAHGVELQLACCELSQAEELYSMLTQTVMQLQSKLSNELERNKQVRDDRAREGGVRWDVWSRMRT